MVLTRYALIKNEDGITQLTVNEKGNFVELCDVRQALAFYTVQNVRAVSDCASLRSYLQLNEKEGLVKAVIDALQMDWERQAKQLQQTITNLTQQNLQIIDKSSPIKDDEKAKLKYTVEVVKKILSDYFEEEVRTEDLEVILKRLVSTVNNTNNTNNTNNNKKGEEKDGIKTQSE